MKISNLLKYTPIVYFIFLQSFSGIAGENAEYTINNDTATTTQESKKNSPSITTLSWQSKQALVLAGVLTPCLIAGNIYIISQVPSEALIFLLPPQICAIFKLKDIDNGNFFASINNNKMKALGLYSLGIGATFLGVAACRRCIFAGVLLIVMYIANGVSK
jgi:hypothetical protein